MKTICRFKGIGVKNKKYRAGDIMLAPWLRNNSILSPEYKRDWLDQRPPLLICLPNGRMWSPDLCAAEDVAGWTVLGEKAEITISPTVICIEESTDSKTYTCYRIKNGVITDEEVSESFIMAHTRR